MYHRAKSSSERMTGKPEIMPDCGTNFRLADNTPRTETTVCPSPSLMFSGFDPAKSTKRGCGSCFRPRVEAAGIGCGSVRPPTDHSQEGQFGRFPPRVPV